VVGKRKTTGVCSQHLGMRGANGAEPATGVADHAVSEINAQRAARRSSGGERRELASRTHADLQHGIAVSHGTELQHTGAGAGVDHPSPRLEHTSDT